MSNTKKLIITSNYQIVDVTMELTYDDIQNILDAGCGDQYYRTTFNPFFVVTTCVYEFFNKCKAFWLGDLINSYIPKIYKEMTTFDDRFFIVNLDVLDDFRKGKIEIQREVYIEETEQTTYHNVIKQNIQFINLPKGRYKFFLIGEFTTSQQYRFVMLSPSEY